MYMKIFFDSTLFGVDYYRAEVWSENADGPDKQLKWATRLSQDELVTKLRAEL